MLNTSSANVHSGKLPLWTFLIFGITIALAIVCTWLITWKYCKMSNERVCITLEKSLQSSQNLLIGNIVAIDHELQNKQFDLASKEKADIWKLKFDTAVSTMNRIQEYTNSIKQKLQQGHGIEFNERRKLIDSLKLFSQNIFFTIPYDKRESLGNLPVHQLLNSTDQNEKWLTVFMEEKNQKMLSFLLTKLQFEVIASTYIVTDFCNMQVRPIDEGYDVFDLLIGQNAQQLMPNKTLKITAGVGTYSSSARPEIVIDGIKQELNAYGLAIFEKKVNKSGIIPIIVSFKNPNTGKTEMKSTTITYTVFQPSKN